MKTLKTSICMLLLCAISTVASAQSVKIINSLSQNNITEFSSYFDKSVKLVIPKTDGSFTKEIAKRKVVSFFNENKIDAFTVIHQGKKNENKYIIGEIKSKNKKYRMQLLIRCAEDNPKIQLIRINQQ